MTQRVFGGLSVLICVVCVVLLCPGCGEEEPEGSSANGNAAGIEPAEWPPWEKEGYTIVFTVNFGRELGPGAHVAFGRDGSPPRARAFMANSIFQPDLTGRRSEVTVTLHGVQPGTYRLWGAVDLDGDTEIGRGDLGGYYVEDGAPGVTDPKRASIIEITDHDVTGLEFTLGELR